MVADPGSKPQRGRPRDNSDPRILEAALELLVTDGFQGMTFEAIAKRARVSRPAIYRRWSDKAALVAEAIARTHRDRPAPTGDLRTDLLAELSDVRRTYANVVPMAMIGTLLAEEDRHPELIEAWRQQVVEPRRERVAGIVRDAISEGRLPASVDPETVSHVLIGAFYGAYTQGSKIDDAWDERVVDLVLSGAHGLS